MAVKLRLRRMGKKRQPIYKVVAADVRSPRDGKYIEAEKLEKKGLYLMLELNLKHYIGISLAKLAGLEVSKGNPTRAAQIFGISDNILHMLGVTRQPADQIEIDRYISMVREKLNEREFQAAWSKGKAMSYEQAVAYALEDSPM